MMADVRSGILHEHALDMLEAADLALSHIDDIGLEEVHRAEQITPAWLESVLSAGVPEARLEQAECVEGHDGMTDRRRWRLSWDTAGEQARLPEAIFVKATPDKPYLRETLSMLHMAEHEVRFYDTLQPDVSDISPKGYFGSFHPGGRFMLITEDLEASGKRPFWLHHECSVEHARSVVTALARLHAAFWETGRFEKDLGWVRPRLTKFGRKWHRQSFQTARGKYPATELAESMPDKVRQILSLWSSNDLAIYDYWASLPQTILHGDSHLGNTYSAPDGTAGYFDWQVIFRENGLRDVSYFLGSALSNDQRTVHEKSIVEGYFDELEARGIAINRAKAWRDFALYGLDRFDAHMKTHVFGGYGHTLEGRIRGRDALFGSLVDYDVLDLMQHVVRTGSLN